MIDQNEGLVEEILEDGGSEATVKLQKRVKFFGLGRDIVTYQAVRAALRFEHSTSPYQGHTMFIRHTVIKKLDDYFLRKRIYTTSHIPRPLGSISQIGENPIEAYFYEWALGGEGFPWEVTVMGGDKYQVHLREWNIFVSHFIAAGINVGYDVADVSNGTLSKNIIHAFPGHINEQFEMSTDWDRIDFGPRSIIIDFDRLRDFLIRNRDELIPVLRPNRYEMVQLCLKYLTSRESMDRYDIAKLEDRIEEYRLATLNHFTSHGTILSGAPVHIDYHKDQTQTLLSD
jgi:hypothetical protein